MEDGEDERVDADRETVDADAVDGVVEFADARRGNAS